jgi:hypothetical protein
VKSALYILYILMLSNSIVGGYGRGVGKTLPILLLHLGCVDSILDRGVVMDLLYLRKVFISPNLVYSKL